MGGIIRFFSSSGRSSVVRFLAVVLVSALIVYTGGWVFDSGGTVAYVAMGALWGVMLAKLFAEGARRLHDTGRNGAWGLGALVMLVVVLAIVTINDLTNQPSWTFWSVLVVALLIGVVLFLLPGEGTANRFGEPPPDRWRSGKAARPDGLTATALFATVSILGSALLAYGAIATMQGMREVHERNARWAEQHRGDQVPDPLAQ